MLIKTIKSNCEELKTLLSINDEKLKLLIEYIIQDIAKKCQDKNFNESMII